MGVVRLDDVPPLFPFSWKTVATGPGDDEAWRANRAAKGDVEAWMDANAANHAWNACAIDRNRYVYFASSFFHKFHQVREVPRSEW